MYDFIFLFFIPFSVTRVEVNNYQEQRTIYNVIATIYGGVEPGMCVCVHCLYVADYVLCSMRTLQPNTVYYVVGY